MYFSQGRIFFELAQESSSVALALHKAGSSSPFWVTYALPSCLCFLGLCSVHVHVSAALLCPLGLFFCLVSSYPLVFVFLCPLSSCCAICPLLVASSGLLLCLLLSCCVLWSLVAPSACFLCSVSSGCVLWLLVVSSVPSLCRMLCPWVVYCLFWLLVASYVF